MFLQRRRWRFYIGQAQKVMTNLLKHRDYAEARFFCQLHKQAYITLPEHGTWKINKGTLQGHSTGGDAFHDLYGEALDQYVANKDSKEETIIFQEEETDLSPTSFVDDIGESVIGYDVQETHLNCDYNTALLHMCLNQVGCKLGPTKEVVVARWMGKNAHQKVLAYQQPSIITGGKRPM